MRKKEISKATHLIYFLLGVLIITLVIFLTLKKSPIQKTDYNQTNLSGSTMLLSQANAFYSSGNYLAATRAYKKIIDDDPQNYLAVTYLGFSYINMGIYDEAIKTFHKTFAFKYYDYRSFYGLGLAYHSMEEYNSSYTNLGIAYQMNPNDKALASNLANTYNALGFYDEAINLSSIMAEKQKGNYNEIAIAYFLKKNFDKSLENAKKASDLGDPNSHLTLGVLYLGSGEYKKAITEFRKASSYSQRNAAFDGLAITYSLLGDDENSSINAKLSEFEYRNSFMTSLLGFALLNSKNTDRAVLEFNLATANTPEYYLPYKGLGEAYLALGKKDKAIENLEKAYKLNNFDMEISKLLDRAKSS